MPAVTGQTLQRAFSGFMRGPVAGKAAFARTGSTYRAHQETSSFRWLYQLKNWFTDLLVSYQYETRVAEKHGVLAQHFDAIAQAILSAPADLGVFGSDGASINFTIAGEEFRILKSEDGAGLVIRHGNESIALHCSLSELKVAMLKAYVAEQRSNGSYARIQFDRIDLCGLNVSGINLSHCDFVNAKMNDTVLINCEFARATFSNCQCRDCVFRGCDWSGADLGNTSLEGTWFRDCQVLGASFMDARGMGFVSVDTELAHFAGPAPAPEAPPSLQGGVARIDASGREYTETTIDLRSKQHFEVMLDRLLTRTIDTCSEVAFVLCRIQTDLARTTGELTIEDWARISLQLEAVLHVIPEGIQDDLAAQVRWDSDRRGPVYLELIARLNWAQMSHDIIVTGMADHYDKVWDLGFSDFNTYGVSVGVSFAEIFSVDLGYSYQSGEVADDERYVGQVKLHTGSVGLSATVGDEMLTDMGAKATATGSGSIGKYKEWDNARHYVELNLEQLLETSNSIVRKFRRKAPADAYRKYFNRAATVASEGEGAKLYRTLEVTGIRALVGSYKNQEEDINQYFNILLDAKPIRARGTGQAAAGITGDNFVVFKDEEGENWRYSNVVCMDDAHGDASEIGGDVDFDVVPDDDPEIDDVDLVKTDETPTSNPTVILQGPAAGPGAPFEAAMTVIAGKGQLTLGDLDTLKSHGAAGLMAKPKVAAEIGWKKTSLKFNEDTLPVAGISKLLRQSATTPDARTKLEKVHAKYKKAAQTLLENLQKIPGGKDLDFGREDVSAWNTCLDKLDRSFSEYRRFQRQQRYGDPTSAASLKAFHNHFGVKNAEELIACFMILNGFFFCSMALQEKGAFDDDEQAEARWAKTQRRCIHFEDMLREPGFPLDQSVVNELVAFRRHGHLHTTDKTFVTTFTIPAGVSEGDGAGAGGTVTVTTQHRTRRHLNPLRAGKYLDHSFNGTVNLTPSVMHYGAEYLAGVTAKGEDVSDGASEEEDISDGASAFSSGCSASTVYVGQTLTRRDYSPEAFPELGRVCLYHKVTTNFGATLGAKTPKIPAGPVGLTVGFGVDRSVTGLARIWYSTETFLQFLLMYLHVFGSNEWDIDSAEAEAEAGLAMPASCYWNTVEREQRPPLEIMFGAIGTDREACNDDQRALRDKLLHELDIIEMRLAERSDNYTKEIAGMQVRKEAFINAARQYAAAGLGGKDVAFNTALSAMKALFRLYHPHVQKRKGEASIYTEKDLDLNKASRLVQVLSGSSPRVATDYASTDPISSFADDSEDYSDAYVSLPKKKVGLVVVPETPIPVSPPGEQSRRSPDRGSGSDESWLEKERDAYDEISETPLLSPKRGFGEHPLGHRDLYQSLLGEEEEEQGDGYYD